MTAEKPMRKVMHEGQVWCSVHDAARYLRTTQAKIRTLMGSGALRYSQQRTGKQIIVSVSDLYEMKHPEQKGRVSG